MLETEPKATIPVPTIPPYPGTAQNYASFPKRSQFSSNPRWWIAFHEQVVVMVVVVAVAAAAVFVFFFDYFFFLFLQEANFSFRFMIIYVQYSMENFNPCGLWGEGGYITSLHHIIKRSWTLQKESV